MASPEEDVNTSLKQTIATLKKLGKAVTDDKAKAAVLRNVSDLQEFVQKLVDEEATLAKLRSDVKTFDAQIAQITTALAAAQTKLDAVKKSRDTNASSQQSSLSRCGDLLNQVRTQNSALNKSIQPYRTASATDPASKAIGGLWKDTNNVTKLQPAK